MSNPQSGELYEFTEPPHGVHPTQAEGLITATNQAFYFRYRSGKVSLLISRTPEVVHYVRDSAELLRLLARRFQTEVDTGWGMPTEQVTELVDQWVAQYIQDVLGTA